MRGLILIALVAVVAVLVGSAAYASAAATASSPRTELRITYWEDGSKSATSRTWTLQCDPVGGTLGTLARERDACRRLGVLGNAFAPPRPTMVCTLQYGGPDQAQITGTYEGRRVWVRLGLADGCQIARFRKLAFLVPAYS